MSHQAGGIIVVLPGPLMLVGAAAAAVGILGYLFLKGCARTAKTCHEKWREHVQDLENKRQEERRQRQEMDRRRMAQFQRSLRDLAQQSAVQMDALDKQRKEWEKSRLEAVEVGIQQSILQDKLAQIEQELKNLAQAQAEPSMPHATPEVDPKEALEKAKAVLEARIAETSFEEAVRPRQATSSEPEPNGDALATPLHVDSEQWRRFLQCVEALAALPYANSDAFHAMHSELQDLSKSPGPDFETRLRTLEARLERMQTENTKREQHSREAQDAFAGLYTRWCTIKEDDGLAPLLADELERLEKTLREAKSRLVESATDFSALAKELQEQCVAFEQTVRNTLMKHQKEAVGSLFVSVLQDMSYEGIQVEDSGEEVRVKGTRKTPSGEAQVTLVMDNEKDRFSLDVSPQGFSSQDECTEEMRKILDALTQKGFAVKLDTVHKTWVEEAVEVVRKTLAQQGYAPERIVEERQGDAVRITATKGKTSPKIVVNTEPTKNVLR
uniref:Uncharacterized protein n=1 Tax=Desulfacinum infernum TaxID=35837 RepID=A0A832EAT7_9BACT